MFLLHVVLLRRHLCVTYIIHWVLKWERFIFIPLLGALLLHNLFRLLREFCTTMGLILGCDAIYYLSVFNLALPCLSSSFIALFSIDALSSSEMSLTYHTHNLCHTDIVAFVPIDNCPMDALSPSQWLAERNISHGAPHCHFNKSDANISRFTAVV